eukprot:gene461-488_t
MSAWRTKQASNLLENYVVEHFEGNTCSDVYEVHASNKLGKGSYGSVYLATHRRTGDDRAVKVMNVDRVTSYYLRKLHTEIAILRRLDHPNIVRLHDVFFGRRSVYLVTQLCRGGELFELLTSGKSQGFVFREDRAAKLLRDMLSAVTYLHDNGVVHRDLKLENFLFEGESATSPLILIDFGLSKLFDKGERIRQPPEVLQGAYDHRCDIWSLGVITYMLLSGCPPFYGKTPEEIHNSTLTAEPEFTERRFRHVSAVGIDFMKRLLTKDPNLRITGKEAMAHPFITSINPRYSLPGERISANASSVSGPLSSKVAEEIIQSFRLYLSSSRLTRLVLGLIAHFICSEKVKHLKEEFLAMDTDHSGSLSPTELLVALTSRRASRGKGNQSKTSITVSELNALFNSVHLNWEGWDGRQVDLVPLTEAPDLRYHQYLAMAMCRRLEIEEHRVRLAFDILDTEKRGYLTSDCLRSALGDDLPETSAILVLTESNRRGEGKIVYSDFIQAWRDASLNPVVEESSEDLIALSNAMSLEGLSPTNRTAGESSGTSSEMEMEGVDSRPSAPVGSDESKSSVTLQPASSAHTSQSPPETVTANCGGIFKWF